MSYNFGLLHLDRDAATSLTEQIVAAVRDAVDAGELEPGSRLPTTRALAEQLGVNALTIARAYRRLAEEGYVTAAVGRGTFVRSLPPQTAPGVSTFRELRGDDWQSVALPERRPSYANEILAETFRFSDERELISLATGWPAPELYPVEALARHTADALAELQGDALAYGTPEGVSVLREELARHGRERGFASDAEEIIVVSGARQGIDLVARTVLGPGDVVAVESPTFIGTLSSLQATGARVIGIPVDEHGLDVDVLERVIARHEVKLVALQSACQNPIGVDLAPERADRLLELAQERSFFVLEDGVYATTRFDGPERQRLRERAPSHVVYVDSLSKTIGGGLRLGWVACQGPIRDRLTALKLQTDVHTSTLIQHVSARYLAGPGHQDLLRSTNAIYAERRDALWDELHRRLPGEFHAIRPIGGHHLWVELTRPVDERLLYREALRHGVTFLPGGAALAEPSSRATLRLSFALLQPDELREGVRRLAVALRAALRTQRGSVAVGIS